LEGSNSWEASLKIVGLAEMGRVGNLWDRGHGANLVGEEIFFLNFLFLENYFSFETSPKFGGPLYLNFESGWRVY